MADKVVGLNKIEAFNSPIKLYLWMANKPQQITTIHASVSTNSTYYLN